MSYPACLSRISLNTLTLNVKSDKVYTRHGVPISVTGIAQVSVCHRTGGRSASRGGAGVFEWTSSFCESSEGKQPSAANKTQLNCVI